MNAISLIVLVCLLAIQAVAAQNPQQQVCARPPKGCDTQMKVQSCINWHGCRWTDNSKFSGDYCRNDNNCADKPTKVPTSPPTPPTPAPTAPPTNPTPPPTSECFQPAKGCKKQNKLKKCQKFPGCTWIRGKNKRCTVRDGC